MEEKFVATPTPPPGACTATHPENPLSGIASSQAWQVAWVSAIALAWSSDQLKADLIADPAKFFQTHCNFKVPDGLTLGVRAMVEADAEGRATGWDAQTKVWYLQNTSVIMYLPPAPEVYQQAIALSAYAATGRTYPFTTG